MIRFYFATQIFNTIVGIYKYFVLGLFSDDFGGGIFWGGGGLNLFCLLLLCFYSSLYFAKKTTFKKFAFIIAATFMNIMKKENGHNSMKPKNLLLSILIDMEKDPGKKCSMSTLCYLKRLKRHKKMMYLEIKSHYAKMNWILLNT